MTYVMQQPLPMVTESDLTSKVNKNTSNMSAKLKQIAYNMM